MPGIYAAAPGSEVLIDKQSLACPYRPAKNFHCSASVMVVAVDDRRSSTYCNTEDFDRCPLFLAKVLRGR